ncbi:MAG TPA: S41 family peptidase [Thermomicrobiales bacterium]|nr:S41 family peptidase [Thermomicrobiales bacterium]
MAPSSVHEESYDPSSERRGTPAWLKVFWIFGVVVVVFLAGVTAGIMLERQRYDTAVVLDDSWQELGEVIHRLEADSYYRPESAGSQGDWQAELERRAIDGLLQGSGDDYAAFLPPAEAAESSQRLTGEYEGVGVSIAENHDGEIEVVSIMVDSPADRADVRVGDVVEAVEATPIPEGDIELASNLLRGEAGTTVSIDFGRDGQEPYSVTLTRERISTGEKTVGYRYFPSDDVAVVQITIFASTTTEELDQALEQARTDGAASLVLDLRGNPGGWVSEARDVIGRFVDPEAGPALLEDTWPPEDGMISIPIGNFEGERFEGKIVVLVDENTASAAEIVASALQHYDRAVVVGEQTFGKGSVQRVYDFETGESLRLTVAEWFTPAGDRLQNLGVTPDVEIVADGPVEDLLPQVMDALEGDAHKSEGTPPAATPAA